MSQLASHIRCPVSPEAGWHSRMALGRVRRTAPVFSIGRISLLLLVVSTISLLALPFAFATDPAESGKAPADIERGRYLVERVAMCGSCHTPLDEKGEPIKEKSLRGGRLPFTTPLSGWAEKSTNIVGLRGWDEADAIKFLMTGLAYNDLPARPPMPQFRMNLEDATAVVHYLRSLYVPSTRPPKP